ncbi:putative secreted RxLR effector protein [Phytophthora cinnamomi]|nr:putative secreted RxLR effector protein [Phytophthora cinnamomi]
MRLSCALLIAAATATVLTSGKAAAADSVGKSSISTMASPGAVVTNTSPLDSTDDHGGVTVRSLRVVDETVDGNPAKAPETEDEEERAPWETMDTDKLIKWIKKGKAPAKILDKMGVKPSFVTAEGQRVYSMYDEGYKFYLHYVKLVREGFF